MSLAEIHALNAAVDAAIAAFVAEAIRTHGVPTSAEEVAALAAVLHPKLNALRRRMYRESVLETGRTLAAIGFEFSPAQERLYPVEAVEALIAQAVGIGVVKNTLPVEVLDPVTKAVSTVRLSPWQVENPDKTVRDVVAGRIVAAGSRHVRAVARQMIADTVQFGAARDAVTKKPARIGYARVLSGAENCPFCAMLASRGPVYKEDTAVRRRDGRRYHDHCDCVAVLVVEGQDWEGRAEYEKLSRLYADSVGVDERGRVDLRGFYKAWGDLDRAEKGKYVPSSQRVDVWKPTTGRYAIGEQTRRWQNLGAVPRLEAAEGIEAYSRSNPNFDKIPGVVPDGMGEKPWNVNCVRCVSTAELRRRGYDVTAGPGTFVAPNGGFNAHEALDIGWRNRETGEPPKFLAMRGNSKKSDRDLVKYLNKSMPDGARGFVTNLWDSVSGHILVWEKKGNRVVFHDPQNGKTNIVPSKYLDGYIEEIDGKLWERRGIMPGSLTAVRIDDCDPVDGVLDVIGGELGQWR